VEWQRARRAMGKAGGGLRTESRTLASFNPVHGEPREAIPLAERDEYFGARRHFARGERGRAYKNLVALGIERVLENAYETRNP